jgi:hypothetical protein
MLAFRTIDDAGKLGHWRVVVAANHDHAERRVNHGPPD